jgi:hypothetical protein
MSGDAPVRLPRKAEELLSIAERMSYLRLLRCGFAIVVVAVGALAPSVREVSFPALLGVTGTYVVLFLVFDTTRELERWLHAYNYHRPHMAHAGRPPITAVNNVPAKHT